MASLICLQLFDGDNVSRSILLGIAFCSVNGRTFFAP
jgi:hypothetical protein